MLKLFKRKNSIIVDQLSNQIQKQLGDNLVMLAEYGSRIREKSKNADINILIVLKNSTPEAHSQLHEICHENPYLRPFVLGERGFEQNTKCFAVKLLSIKRHYKLLAGRDLLEDIEVDQEHERFLTDQAIRNLRLRLIRSYVINGPSLQYRNHIVSQTTSLFVDISEILHCDGVNVPDRFSDRIAKFEKHFGMSFAVLSELYRVKKEDLRLTKKELESFHHNLFKLLDNVVLYLERSWYE